MTNSASGNCLHSRVAKILRGVHTCTCLLTPKRIVYVHVDWIMILMYSHVVDTGFEIPDEFVVGYALDYNEYFRDLNVRQ